ncbi:MAG: hypothetical protein AAB401_03895 [Acidobacteriota bacterium]
MTNQVTKETTTSKGFFKEALDTTTEQVVRAGLKVEALKEQASQSIEDGIEDAKRMAKRGRYAAEDLMEDTAHRIKQDPLRSVGVTFGIGFGLGAIVGLLAAHKSKA